MAASGSLALEAPSDSPRTALRRHAANDEAYFNTERRLGAGASTEQRLWQRERFLTNAERPAERKGRSWRYRGTWDSWE